MPFYCACHAKETSGSRCSVTGDECFKMESQERAFESGGWEGYATKDEIAECDRLQYEALNWNPTEWRTGSAEARAAGKTLHDYVDRMVAKYRSRL